MIRGNIYVRMQPPKELDAKGAAWNEKQVINAAELQKAKTLFDLEMWLNGEIAIQAFEKFGVGIRVHVPED